MIDAYTDTWRDIAAKCNEIIEAGRSRLETADQGYGESQYIRGRISAMRELLALVRPVVVATRDPEDFSRSRDRSGI